MSFSRTTIKNDAGEPIGIDYHYDDSELLWAEDDYYGDENEPDPDETYINCEKKKNLTHCFDNYHEAWANSGVHSSFDYWMYKNPFDNFACEPCQIENELEDVYTR
jgi:hypothetical protein